MANSVFISRNPLRDFDLLELARRERAVAVETPGEEPARRRLLSNSRRNAAAISAASVGKRFGTTDAHR